MKSNVCRIEKGIKDLAAILKESEKVAVYNELDAKQTAQLRLICEELDGMLPELVGDFCGDIWFDFDNRVCKIIVSIEIAEMSLQHKEQLISIAKSKANAAATGIIGKIRSSIENLFLDEDFAEALAMSSGSFHISPSYGVAAGYSYYWSLEQYRNTVKSENKSDEWDELEKSVITSVADDVVVGVKGKHADIIITKKFA